MDSTATVRGRRPRSEGSTDAAKADGYEFPLYRYGRDALPARKLFDLGPGIWTEGEVDLVVDGAGTVELRLEGVGVLTVGVGVYEHRFGHMFP